MNTPVYGIFNVTKGRFVIDGDSDSDPQLVFQTTDETFAHLAMRRVAEIDHMAAILKKRQPNTYTIRELK